MSKKEGIDVQNIMRKIRADIHRKNLEASGESQEDTKPYDVDADLEFISSSCDTENRNYRIFSHRKLTGPFLIKGRELVHGEIRRYADPVFLRQRDFNLCVARILNYLVDKLPKTRKSRQKASKRK